MKSEEYGEDIVRRLSEGRLKLVTGELESVKGVFEDAFAKNPRAWWRAMEALRVLRMCEQGSDEDDKALLAFSPNYSRANSYQPNLYSRAEESGFSVRPINGLHLNAELAKASKRKRFVLHQHWLKEVYWTSVDRADGWNRIDTHIGILKACKAFGAKVIWSLHNLLDHDASPLQAELCGYANKEMAQVCDRIYVHSRSAIDELSRQCQIDLKDKCALLEHPLYEEMAALSGVHLPPELSEGWLSRMRAAKRRIAVNIGMIRPYKGIVDLLEAFESLTQRSPAHPLALVVAGELRDSDVPAAFGRLSNEAQDRVVLIPRRVSNEEVAALLRLASVNVTPYRKILTSGSFYLATTFAKPTLAPCIGMFPEVIEDGQTGLLYEGTKRSLIEALERVSTMNVAELEKIGMRALYRNRHLSIQNVSRRFFQSMATE